MSDAGGPPAWIRALEPDAITVEPSSAGGDPTWVASLSFELWSGPPLGMAEDCNKRGGRVVGSLGELSCAEVEIAKRLQVHRWDGGWFNTFGGCGRRRWGDFMIGRNDILPATSRLIERVRAELGAAGGVPDVIAWRRKEIIYIESKGPGDNTNKQREWLAAALRLGLDPRSFALVRWVARAK